MKDRISLAEARRQFNLDDRIVHLDAMLVASHPAPVRRAIRSYQRALDRDPDGYNRQRIGKQNRYRVIELLDRVARKALEYLDIRTELPASTHVCLTDSTTTGLGLLYNGIRIRRGQEIVTTPHDFFSTQRALELRSLKSRVAVRKIPLFADSRRATQTEILNNLKKAVGPRTRVLALTWVQSNTGVKLPIGKIGRLVAEINSGRSESDRLLLCVDGVHGFGVENTSFEDLHCDFLVAGCHKWLFGPRGTAIVCGRPTSWEHVTPTVPSLYGGRGSGGSNSPGGVLSYEYRWALADAFDFHLRIGKGRIEAHTRKMAYRLKKGLDRLARVAVVTPIRDDKSSGVVCCDIEGLSPDGGVARLRSEHKIAASVSSPDAAGRSYFRFSPSILNTAEEIDRSVEAVERLVAGQD